MRASFHLKSHVIIMKMDVVSRAFNLQQLREGEKKSYFSNKDVPAYQGWGGKKLILRCVRILSWKITVCLDAEKSIIGHLKPNSDNLVKVGRALLAAEPTGWWDITNVNICVLFRLISFPVSLGYLSSFGGDGWGWVRIMDVNVSVYFNRLNDRFLSLGIKSNCIELDRMGSNYEAFPIHTLCADLRTNC